jgi:hypothetical protein
MAGSNKKKFPDDFYVYVDIEFPEETSGEAVFAGYGIETDRYSDYVDPVKKQSMSVKGKYVIILPGDPLI